MELFAVDSAEDEDEERRSSQLVNQPQRPESNMVEEENKKMYTALLQNQVLGIDNPYLLHEIHNRDENYMKHDLYSHMQRQHNPEDLGSSSGFSRKNTLLGGSSQDFDSSPFNSKFTVLRFNNQTSAFGPQLSKQGAGLFSQDFSVMQRGHFSNVSNYAQSYLSDTISQSSQSSAFGLSENMSPPTHQPTFRHNPLSGFDEESVIVPKKKQRKISKIPFKVLDAPSLQDDFYLNLVDWSPYNNLAVGLSSCIYIWSASSSKVTKLADLGSSDSVTSVCWSKRGQHLSVGTNSGLVQIWDVNKCKLVRTLKGHEGRVGTIAWSPNVLSSGSKDKSILNRDLRQKDDYFGSLLYHKQEVCGLKWSYD